MKDPFSCNIIEFFFKSTEKFMARVNLGRSPEAQDGSIELKGGETAGNR